jgi:hypothetical protein
MVDRQIREGHQQFNSWTTEAGSGKLLGKLYVEIMGHDSLPNMDFGTLDFATKRMHLRVLFFEDEVVVLMLFGDDSLSPRWMPWNLSSST